MELNSGSGSGRLHGRLRGNAEAGAADHPARDSIAGFHGSVHVAAGLKTCVLANEVQPASQLVLARASHDAHVLPDLRADETAFGEFPAGPVLKQLVPVILRADPGEDL